ncbi:MAG: hypothetical protein ACOYNS_07820 [Bacteroidota bacterium]
MKILWLFVPAAMMMSCNEGLPVRDDLSSQVTTSLRSGYVFQSNRSYLRFYLSVKNNLDETLEGVAAIRGTIVVTWLPTPNDDGDFNKSRTFTIKKDDIFTGIKNYNQLTGRLSIPPGDSIVFYANWDLKTDDSTYLTDHFQVHQENGCNVTYSDFSSGKRRISDRQKFMFSASIKLFDQLAILYSESVLTAQCVVVSYMFEGGNCPNLNLVDPCSLIGQ